MDSKRGCLVWMGEAIVKRGNAYYGDGRLHITPEEDITFILSCFGLDVYPQKTYDGLFALQGILDEPFYALCKHLVQSYFLIPGSFVPTEDGEHPFLGIKDYQKIISPEYISVLKKIYCFKVHDSFDIAITKTSEYTEKMQQIITKINSAH